MLRRVTVGSAVAGLALLLTAPSATADAQGVWASDGGNTISVGAQSAGSSGAAPAATAQFHASGGPPPACVLVPMPSYEALVGPGGPGPGQWIGIECDGQLPLNMTANGLITWVPAGANPNGGAPVVDPAVVAQQAEASIRLPGPAVDLNPAGDGWVNLPEWFWLDPAGWHPFAATASVAGVSATATASPQYVTWAPGDGGSLRCHGPGTPYDRSRPASSQSSDCTWTYRTDSAGQPNGVYTITATIHWAVTWAGAGAGGALPALTTTVTTTLPVGQIESVNND